MPKGKINCLARLIVVPAGANYFLQYNTVNDLFIVLWTYSQIEMG